VEVKGTAFLSRRGFIDKEHGAGTFEGIVRRQAKVDPVFRDPILATTRLPIEPFLRLNERIVAELYGGDDRSYLRVGELSAEWALAEGGPYHHLVKGRDIEAFSRSAPAIYKNYFTEGAAEAHVDPKDPTKITLQLVGIAIPHKYFEYAIIGYFRCGLGIVSGKNVVETCVRGFSKGDRDVLYRYEVR
jgi:hypothetical protein